MTLNDSVLIEDLSNAKCKNSNREKQKRRLEVYGYETSLFFVAVMFFVAKLVAEAYIPSARIELSDATVLSFVVRSLRMVGVLVRPAFLLCSFA